MRRSHRFPIEPPGDLIGVAKFADISAFAVPRRGRNADRIVTLLLRQTLSSANLRNAATPSICSRWTWESFKVGNVETDPSNFTWHGAVEFARRQVALLSSTNHTSSCKPEILWNPQKTWVDLVDFVHVQTNLSALRVRLWIAVHKSYTPNLPASGASGNSDSDPTQSWFCIWIQRINTNHTSWRQFKIHKTLTFPRQMIKG